MLSRIRLPLNQTVLPNRHLTVQVDTRLPPLYHSSLPVSCELSLSRVWISSANKMASLLLVNALSFTVILAVVLAAPQEPASRVHVTVYYESYCPDSVNFLDKQLYPVYNSPLASSVNLTLVPFGKSSFTRNDTGSYVFTCHHGTKECIGNKIHACAINLLSFDQAFKFIDCASQMIIKNPKTESYPGQECAKTNSINYDSILQCVSGSQGDELLAAYGNKTEELDPKLPSVPYVVFNQKFEEGVSAKAVADFKSALCGHISGTKPAECNTKSSAISVQATILPAVIALLISRI